MFCHKNHLYPLIIVIPKVITLDPHVSLFCHSFCLISPFHFWCLCPSTPSASASRVKVKGGCKSVDSSVWGLRTTTPAGEGEVCVYMLVCVWEECWWWRWPLIGRSVLWGEWDLHTAAQAGICAWEVFNFLKSQLHSAGGGLLFCLQLCSLGCPCVWILNVCVQYVRGWSTRGLIG